jgi:hypothetical protein
MKKILYLLSLIFLLAACQINPVNKIIPPAPVACTMEAKLCPDGTAVGRSGPNCEFAPCPGAATSTPEVKGKSGITGISLLGPVCPVEKNPPDPACAPRPYPALIIVKTADGKNEVTRFNTDQNGEFKINLPAGTYFLEPQSGKVFPRGIEQTVVVKSGIFTPINLNFDSGIR